MPRSRLTLWLLVPALAAAPTVHATSQPQPISIYASLPLRGPDGSQPRDMVRAMRLALNAAGGQAGGHPVRLIALDGGDAAGRWAVRRTIANARRAAQDRAAVAYLGEFNSGASAISIPLLNTAGVAQISPSNTYVGLTRREGADRARGEPDRYYPTGHRTYARVVPADHLEAGALVDDMRRHHVHRVFIVDDRKSYGAGIARMVTRRIRSAHITPVGSAHLQTRHTNSAAAIAARVVASHAQGVLYSGGPPNNAAAELWRAASRRSRRLLFFGNDAVLAAWFAARIPRGAAQRTFATAPTLPDAARPAAGQRFIAAFRTRYGHTPAAYGVYAYETMALALDAVTRAGDQPNIDALRRAVIDALFATRARHSVLGVYSIDAYGDTTLRAYGGFRLDRRRQWRFDTVLDTRAG